MESSDVLYWVIAFIVTIIVAWIALSLILTWAKPSLYKSDGALNWGTTLWVAALTVVFAWIIMLILYWIFFAISGAYGMGRGTECCA